MKIKKIALILSLFLSSCCKVPCINYIVKNNTEYPIMVVTKVASEYIANTPQDTFMVAAGKDTVVAIRTDAITGAINYRLEKIMEHGDTLQAIETLHVYKNDTIIAPAYFLVTNRWVFKEVASFIGDYTLTISNTDF